MPSNKRHHYVPQFYLRQFGIGEKKIGVATVEPFRFITSGGSIKGQCQQDNFYGNDLILEGIYKDSESAVAPTLYRLNSARTIDESDRPNLSLLIVQLHHRTRKASEIAQLPTRNVVAFLLKCAVKRGELPAPSDPDDYERFNFPDTPKVLAGTTVAMLYESLTLDFRLLKTAESSFFITSDNPAILMNEFAYRANADNPHVGFAQAGFQMVLPIGPEICLCFFDPRLYRMFGRTGEIITISALDTDLLNGLQVQAAEHCIYFHRLDVEQIVRNLISRYGQYRQPIGNSLVEFPAGKKGDSMLWMRTPHPRLPRTWAFMKRIHNARISPGDRRDPVWTKAIETTFEEMRKDPDGRGFQSRLEEVLCRFDPALKAHLQNNPLR